MADSDPSQGCDHHQAKIDEAYTGLYGTLLQKSTAGSTTTSVRSEEMINNLETWKPNWELPSEGTTPTAKDCENITELITRIRQCLQEKNPRRSDWQSANEIIERLPAKKGTEDDTTHGDPTDNRTIQDDRLHGRCTHCRQLMHTFD
jgi:hypothetical protein